MTSEPPENRDLGNRIAAAQAKHAVKASKRPGSNATSGYGIGMKMVFDLIGGAVVGVVFGLAFDHLAGTEPFGLLVILTLGLIAGFRLMLRTAEQQAKRVADEAKLTQPGSGAEFEGQEQT